MLGLQHVLRGLHQALLVSSLSGDGGQVQVQARKVLGGPHDLGESQLVLSHRVIEPS